jgi:ABC-type Na+ efflux pump permease subunit
VDNITVPVPSERTAEFFSLYAGWLAAPPTSGEVRDWDARRAGELDLAGTVWGGLTADERALLDAVNASGRIEAQQAAQALKLSGAVAVAQQARAVNAVAARYGRREILVVSAQLEGALFVCLDAAAASALLGDPQARSGPPAPP